MTLVHRFDTEPLRLRLLDRLKGLSRPGAHGRHPVAGQLFTYCTTDRERIVQTRLDHPLLGIVLKGAKEIWIGDRSERQGPGDAFVLPKGVTLDLVNIPDARSGYYESVIFELDTLPPATQPRVARPSAATVFRVPLTPDLVETLGHAATAIADPRLRAQVKTHRMAELLALLQDVPAARSVFERSLAETLAWHIAEAPEAAWTVEMLALRLGLGASTLRRRLAEEGTSFRAVLAEVRMRVAERALAAGASSLAAAEAAGYRSRSHFARAYRDRFGAVPSGRKPRAKGSGG